MGEGLIRANAAAAGLKVGNTIQDNDPRMFGRRLRIESFTTAGGYVYARCGIARGNASRFVEIRLNRIHTDDKPRKSGFSLVRETATSDDSKDRAQSAGTTPHKDHP